MKRLFQDKETLNKLLRVVLVLLIITVIATPLIGTMYTFMSEDDFSYESGGKNGAAEYQSSIVSSFYKTVNIYKSQQGCYTPMFLDHLFIPYSRFGFPGFHAAMFTYVALFIVSLAVIIFSLVKDKTASLVVLLAALMSVFTMSYTHMDTDIMFWHTETLGYTLMMAFLFFGIYYSIMSFRKDGFKTVLCIIASSLFAFLASGASLTVTAVNCALLLAVLILNYEKLQNRKYLVIPFVSGFIGALINAVAPGNFIRADDSLVPGHETLLDGFRDTFSCLFEAFPKAVDIIFILMTVIVIAICIIYKVEVLRGGISNARMLIVLGGVLLLQYFEVFPGAFGSHVYVFTGHLAIEHYIITRLTFLFVAVCFAQWLREHVSALENSKTILKGICAVATLLILVLPVTRGILHDSFTARTYRDFRSGTYNRVFHIREFEVSTFELAEDGTDCIVYQKWDVSSETLPGMGITEDSEWFVNRSAANLFGLHTTTVLIQE